jgi:membrane protein involved in colicin uptake
MWTRILSQTEHNQRLILDPQWQGASQDMADMEAEAAAKKNAAARKDAEDQERRANAARKAEEEEKRRAAEAAKQQKSSMRVRGRVTTRGANTATSGYVGDTSTMSSTRGTTFIRRTTSGIGRGRGGRGRG